jgi:hypothetical protein
MKNTLLTLLVGTIFGIFIASKLQCEKAETKVVTKIEYVDKEIVVAVEKIIYESLPTTDTIIYKDRYVYDTIIGDTVYVPVPVPVNYTIYNERFEYTGNDSVMIKGIAEIIAQDLHQFKFKELEYKYKGKIITKEITLLERKDILLLGSSFGWSKSSPVDVSFNASWKMKSNRIFYYEIGIPLSSQNIINRIGFKIPIKIRK